MRKVALFFILGLAYAYAAIAFGHTSEVLFDSQQYFAYGRNLIETGVYGLNPGIPDMSREPGYGFYLAGLFTLVRGFRLAPDFVTLAEPAHIFWVKALQALALFLSAGLCAFRGGLPEKMRRPFFFLCILSPTFLGTMRELFSEALSIPLSLLFLYFLSCSLAGRSRWNLFGLSLAQGAMVLTKSYLYFLSFPFLLLAILWALRRRFTPIFFVSLAISLGGIAAQKSWNARNAAQLGENLDETRLSIALAGKVARLDRVSWSQELPVALAASLGSNFCDGHFSESRCSLFDYRGCDKIGNEVLVQYRQNFKSEHLADQAIKRDMLQLYLHRPITQVAGSGLELLRMFFFEAVLDSGTLPAPFQTLARAWHILGSLLLWLFVALSFRGFAREIPSGNPELQLALACSGVVVYHAVSMAQITNVVRYVFPVLPFIYFFAADGVARLYEKKIAGRAK